MNFKPVSAAFCLLAWGVSAALAAGTSTADTPPAPAGPAESGVSGTGALTEDAVLTPEEKAEKEGRKACKAEICAAFRSPSALGREDIACDVKKSWRQAQLVKMVARLKVTWPYGPVRCTSALKLKRSELAKAMTEQKHHTQLDRHAVTCEVDREKEPPAEIKVEFSPMVSFENGKAMSAKMNWGKIEAPALIKGAMWTATAADNTVNMLSASLVEDINDFIAKKCEEVKEETQGAGK